MSADFKQRYDDLQEALRQFDEDLLRELGQTVPDAPGVTRISENPHIFTIKLSQLDHGNLLPQHYDTKWQMTRIIEKLQGKENKLKALQKIAAEGVVDKVSLHSVVLEHIRKVIGE